MTVTKQRPDLATWQGRLAAAYKDNLMLLPGWPRGYVGDEPDVFHHRGFVTPTDTANLTPYEVEIHEKIIGPGSHLKVHCTCEGGDIWGKACKHAALVLDAAGLLREGWTYEVLTGEEVRNES